MAMHLAEQSAALGLVDDAARLLDLSGDDEAFSRFLSEAASKGGDGGEAAREQERALRLAAAVAYGEDGVAGDVRRPALLAGVRRFPQASVAVRMGNLRTAAMRACS